MTSSLQILYSHYCDTVCSTFVQMVVKKQYFDHIEFVYYSWRVSLFYFFILFSSFLFRYDYSFFQLAFFPSYKLYTGLNHSPRLIYATRQQKYICCFCYLYLSRNLSPFGDKQAIKSHKIEKPPGMVGALRFLSRRSAHSSLCSALSPLSGLSPALVSRTNPLARLSFVPSVRQCLYSNQLHPMGSGWLSTMSKPPSTAARPDLPDIHVVFPELDDQLKHKDNISTAFTKQGAYNPVFWTWDTLLLNHAAQTSLPFDFNAVHARLQRHRQIGRVFVFGERVTSTQELMHT